MGQRGHYGDYSITEPRLRVWCRVCNLLHNVQSCKEAAIVCRLCKASDELERGNHLTLPKLEDDTSRPAT